MTWDTAKTEYDATLQAATTASEVEADGHKFRSRTVNEMVQLEDLINTRKSEEDLGSSPLKQAGFRVQAFNNGSGLI
jgi:hypothetical protein